MIAYISGNDNNNRVIMPIPKKPRKCLICNKTFKPMTDKMWKTVKYRHETLSLKHKAYLNLKKKKP